MRRCGPGHRPNPCALCLALDHPRRELEFSTVLARYGAAFLPNFGGQDLVGAAAKAAIRMKRPIPHIYRPLDPSKPNGECFCGNKRDAHHLFPGDAA